MCTIDRRTLFMYGQLHKLAGIMQRWLHAVVQVSGTKCFLIAKKEGCQVLLQRHAETTASNRGLDFTGIQSASACQSLQVLGISVDDSSEVGLT